MGVRSHLVARAFLFAVGLFACSNSFAARKVVQLIPEQCLGILTTAEVESAFSTSHAYLKLHETFTLEERQLLVAFFDYMSKLAESKLAASLDTLTLLLGKVAVHRLYVDLLQDPAVLREVLKMFQFAAEKKPRVKGFDIWILKLAGCNHTPDQLANFAAELKGVRSYMAAYPDAQIKLGIDIQLLKDQSRVKDRQRAQIARKAKTNLKKQTSGPIKVTTTTGMNPLNDPADPVKDFDFLVLREGEDQNIKVEVKKRSPGSSRDPSSIGPLLRNIASKSWEMHKQNETARLEAMIYIDLPPMFTIRKFQVEGTFPNYAYLREGQYDVVRSDWMLEQIWNHARGKSSDAADLQYMFRIMVVNTNDNVQMMATYENRGGQWVRKSLKRIPTVLR